MRILFLNTRLSGRSTAGEGSGAHFRGVAEYLMRQGHQVFLPPADRLAFAQAVGAVSLWRPWQLARLDAIYIRIEGRPVRFPGRFPAAMFRLLKRLLRWHVIWEINAAPDLIAFNGGVLDETLRATLDRQMRAQARGVDVAICNTRGLCRFAQDIGIRRTVHIELGTWPAAIMPSRHASPRLEVCWLAGNSRVSWHDAATVLEAAQRLQSNPGIRFHFVGDFDPAPALPNVTYHGRVNPARMAELLQQMDVGLAIYGGEQWSRYGVFSSPLKVFDYMAAGLYVVASPIEQINTLIERGAGVTAAPFENAAALAGILSGLHKDAHFLQRCDDNTRLAREFYHWDRVGAMTDRVVRCDFDPGMLQ